MEAGETYKYGFTRSLEPLLSGIVRAAAGAYRYLAMVAESGGNAGLRPRQGEAEDMDEAQDPA
jgi:hypothetical protein